MDGPDNDYGFCFPLNLEKLQNERVKLVPFESDFERFSKLYIEHFARPEAESNFIYLPYGPFPTVPEFQYFYDTVIRPKHADMIWLAILVKPEAARSAQPSDGGYGNAASETEQFAGSLAMMNASAQDAHAEIGHINIVPAWQRTFVASNANGLLLNFMLDLPSEGGLGLRRVQWFANASNARSRAAAERLGFQFEGILRWHRVLGQGKEDSGDAREKEVNDGRGPARHSALLSLCWDDWRYGARYKVQAMMNRV